LAHDPAASWPNPHGAEEALSIAPIERPGYPAQLSFVEPHRVPKRGAGSDAGRIHLFHAIAHIEFSAINLALDAIYRFPRMPAEYHQDWLRVAREEMEHFAMIRERLRELDSDYGAMPVHDGLWAMARKTDGDPLARMALVPRYLEARGLDVNPGMQKRLRDAGDERGVEILEVILRDEIGHVGRGDHWFRYLCRERDLPPESAYRELVEHYAKQPWHGPFHCAARREAGFSEEELKQLGCEETG
jgi:uncharacterized ferritin-like protein (DUF455 family)